MPRASFMSCLLCRFLGLGLSVQRPDDQSIERRMLGSKPARGDRARGDEDALAEPAAEDVEGDEPGAVVRLDLEECAAGDPVDAPGGPHRTRHGGLQHVLSFSISTPSAFAWSRASGVRTAPRPRTSRAPSSAARRTMRSVTAPFSMRRAGAPPLERGTGAVGRNANRTCPVRIACRSRGLSRRLARERTKLFRSSSLSMLTLSARPSADASWEIFPVYGGLSPTISPGAAGAAQVDGRRTAATGGAGTRGTGSGSAATA